MNIHLGADNKIVSFCNEVHYCKLKQKKVSQEKEAPYNNKKMQPHLQIYLSTISLFSTFKWFIIHIVNSHTSVDPY